VMKRTRIEKVNIPDNDKLMKQLQAMKYAVIPSPALAHNASFDVLKTNP